MPPESVTCCTAPSGVWGRARARRSKVMEAARKLFSAKGFHNTGMAQIAAESDVKVGQIYRDFPSKEAIVAAIVEADFTAFVDTDSLRTAIDEGDRAGVLAAIGRWFDPGPCEQMMPEIIAEAARNPRIAATIQALDTRCLATLEAALHVFAPCTTMAARRAAVAETIMVLVVGRCHRAVAASRCSDAAGASSDPIRILVAREIARLAEPQDA